MAETVGEYQVVLVLNADDYKKGLAQAESSAEETESRISKIGKNIAKGTVAALGAATAAIGKITTEAVQSFADYEQLTGGMETLFKDSAGSAIENATQAYKTAGLSMNNYMETVTSFSASLISSLEGDTEAAVKYADMAIIDMADNANKMGTSIESIQNAYQGFAKQNYTMLDNLKLGYGGTKEEMQRLLEDAQAISGIEYDISSYADVVDAIHVIQTEMEISGLTVEEAARLVEEGVLTEEEAFQRLGTTAKEATTTISGSISSMKAAWSNLLVAMADDNMPFEQYVTNFVNSVSTVMENLLPRISIALNGCVQLINQLAPQIIAKIPELLNTLLPTIVNAAIGLVNALVAAMPGIVSALMAALPTLIQGVQDLISGVVAVLPELLQTIIETAVTLVPMLAQAIIDMLPVLLDTGLAMIEGLAQSILEAIPVLIAALPELINSIVTFILGAIPQIIETGISLLTALVEALPTIIETIVAVLPQIVENIITNLLNMIPLIVDAGITLLISLVQALPTIITTIIDAVPKIVNSICDVFINNIDKIIDAGVQLFIALVSNLPTIITEILKAVPQIITSLVNAIGESVPKIAEAGTNLVKGLFNGISNAVSWLYGKLSGWVSSVLSYIKSLFGIHSPATTTAEFGMYVAKGLGVGIEENTDSATDAAATMGEKVLDTFSDVTDEINNVQKDMFSGANTDFEIKASVDYDKSGALTSAVDSSVDVTNNGLINGLSSVFNNLTNKVDNVGNRIVNAIMNTNGVAPAGRSVIVNVGGWSVSGLIGNEAVTQIENIANGIVDDVITSVASALPA